MEDKKEQKFKAIPVNGSTNYNKSSGFGKSILVPFISGVLGCTIVIRNLFWCSFN